MKRKSAKMLRESGLSLAIAESCTGGLLCSNITDVAGSSDYFLGGIISYSNQVKVRQLGVDSGVLEKCGAVSRDVALAMARGVREKLQSDLGIGTTGIAGPGGETPGKPVGLVYVALSAREGDWCERYVWDGDRITNKEKTVQAALSLLVEYLAGRLE